MTAGKTEATPVDESFLESFLLRALDAFNSHDADAFVDLMTEDVVLDHSAWPTTMHGRSQVRTFYSDYVWKAFPDIRLDREDGPFLHPHAPRVSVAWRLLGTHDGPMNPPGLAATGKRVEFPVREVAEFRDGHLSRFQIVFDTAELMRQLGVLPARGSFAEQAMAALQRLQMKIARRGG